LATPTWPAEQCAPTPRRNYERLLTEARLAFAEHGIDASLEEIARRCGVGIGIGIGTLYRHFPTRETLVEAVAREEFDAVAARAVELLTAADPLAALHDCLRAFIHAVGRYRRLTAAVLWTLQDQTSELARKRPHLVPVYDEVTSCLFGEPDHVWLGLHDQLASNDGALRSELDQVRERAGVPAVVGLIRAWSGSSM
jgi:AcrR family transcriptional regulator